MAKIIVEDIARVHDARYGIGGAEVFEKNGILYTPRGEPYPNDPGEITRRGLPMPEGKMAAVRARFNLRKAAEQRVEYVDVPSKPADGPERHVNLQELLDTAGEAQAKNTLSKLTKAKGEKKVFGKVSKKR